VSERDVTVAAAQLVSLSQSILEAVGTPEDIASMVASSLVDANLAGHDSHGVLRLPSYVEHVRNGHVKPAERPTAETLGAACARIDGRWAWGQPAAQLAIATARQIAMQAGSAVVVIAHCNHIGRLGEYVERLSAAGMIGIVMSNSKVAVAPYGGYTRLLGTNPFAWSAPRDSTAPPVVVDFATSSVAEGKLRTARAGDSRPPVGAIVDRDGTPTDDPEAFYAGGALTTFGGHKGYGLSVMAELTAGILSGAQPSCLPGYDNGNGTCVIAIDIQRFVPLSQFVRLSEDFSTRIEGAPPAPGVSMVLMPGQPEWRARRARSEEGVSIPIPTYEAIQALLAELGLPQPKRETIRNSRD
jgi:LDH2 family malate/lactate/ureidoglycolate dehydrogenase